MTQLAVDEVIERCRSRRPRPFSAGTAEVMTPPSSWNVKKGLKDEHWQHCYDDMALDSTLKISSSSSSSSQVMGTHSPGASTNNEFVCADADFENALVMLKKEQTKIRTIVPDFSITAPSSDQAWHRHRHRRQIMKKKNSYSDAYYDDDEKEAHQTWRAISQSTATMAAVPLNSPGDRSFDGGHEAGFLHRIKTLKTTPATSSTTSVMQHQTISDEVIEEAVKMHAITLGMDPSAEEDQQFMWIAKESLLADPPQGWTQHIIDTLSASNDEFSKELNFLYRAQKEKQDATSINPLSSSPPPYYYYHSETNQISFEHPGDEYYRNLYCKKKAELTKSYEHYNHQRNRKDSRQGFPHLTPSLGERRPVHKQDALIRTPSGRKVVNNFEEHWNQILSSLEELLRHSDDSSQQSASTLTHEDSPRAIPASTPQRSNGHHHPKPDEIIPNRLKELVTVLQQHFKMGENVHIKTENDGTTASDSQLPSLQVERERKEMIHKIAQQSNHIEALHDYIERLEREKALALETKNGMESKALQVVRDERDEVAEKRIHNMQELMEARLSETARKTEERIHALTADHNVVVEDFKKRASEDWKARLDLKSELESLRRELETSKQEHKEKLLHESKKGKHTADKAIKQTEHRLHQNYMDEIRSLKQEKEDLRRQNQALILDATNLRSSTSTQLAEVGRKMQQKHEQNVEEKDEECRRLRQSYEEMQKHSETLQRHLEEAATRESRLSTAASSQMEERLREHQKEIDTMRQRELDMRKEFDNMKEKLLKNHEATELYSNMGQELESTRNHLSKARSDIDEGTKLREQIINDYEEAIRRLKGELAQSTKCQKELELAIGRERQELNDSSKQVRDLKKVIKQKEEELSNFFKVVEDMQKELSSRSEQEVKHTQELEEWRDQFEALCRNLREEKQRNAYLHKQVSDLQGNIRVFCRVRPLRASEILEIKDGNDDPRNLIEYVDDEHFVFSGSQFTFDKIFDPSSDQTSVYKEVSSAVATSLDGCNVCVFAYGQTSSGKTYTMQGTPQEKGVYFRALEELFYLSEDSDPVSHSPSSKGSVQNPSYHFAVSVLEVYNESIRDLLIDSKSFTDKSKSNVSGTGLDIRLSRETEEVYVENLVSREVTCSADVEALLTLATSNRQVANNNLNEHSSRSHLVLQVTITCHLPNKTGHGSRAGTVKRGKLTLVDLAGSERLKQTGAVGVRLKEAQNINRSLSALGDVIEALGRTSSQSGKHIPYRNSKLTYLLQDTLKPSSRVLMFVNVSPAVRSIQESMFSLRFASRCRNVSLGKARKEVISNS